MPLSRLRGAEVASVRPPEDLRTRRPDEAGAGVVRAPLPAPASAGLRTGGAGGTDDVPAGTDPAVWLGLTAEERAFFARLEALGPLSYGPARAEGGPALSRGRYIHIRV